MDYAAETRFVRAFIRKERRERLLYELTTPKKRYNGVSRFCHQAEELLDPAKLVMAGEDLERRAAFVRFARAHDGPCRLLSPFPWLDGRVLPFGDAVREASQCPDAVLILGDGFAVVFGEPVKGGRGKYLLSEKNLLSV